MPRRLRLAAAASSVLACLLAAPGAAAAAPELSKDDVTALAMAMAQPWPSVQEGSGTYDDFTDHLPGKPDTRYGDAFTGWALVQLGAGESDQTLIDSGLRAVSYSVRRFGEFRKTHEQSVFENWAVAAAYDIARRKLADNEIWGRERGRWEDFLRVSRAERSGITTSYGNHWLVDASGVLEALRSGLHSSRSDAVLGGRRAAARAAAESLVNHRVPDLAPSGSGPFVLSDPPDNPLAYEGLSVGVYAHLIRALGKKASGRAKATLRRAVEALWYDTAPDGDSAYFGRSQEMVWSAAGAAYGALVAANLASTSADDAARFRALADRSLARVRHAYPISDRGQFYVPGLAVDVDGTLPWLDGYAGGPSMDGIALVMVELALEEMKSDATVSRLAADRSLSRGVGSGRGRIGMVRKGPVWFALRMQPTINRLHVGDLRYDSGLAIAKRKADDGTWHDFVPVRPKTATPGFDSAGPNVLDGNTVVGVPTGDRLEFSGGRISMFGAIRTRSGTGLAPLRARYVATSCGVQLRFAAEPSLLYEYSAFFRGSKSPTRDGGTLTGAEQVVTTDPAPETVHIKKSYGSANDPHLVRVRMRFRVSKARTVRVEMC